MTTVGDGDAEAPVDGDREMEAVTDGVTVEDWVSEGVNDGVVDGDGDADREVDGVGVADMGTGEYAPGARLEPASRVYTIVGRRFGAEMPL